MQSLGLVAAGALLALSTSAVRAITFDISFVDDGTAAAGVLTADPMAGGGYLVSGGSLTVTADSPSSPSAVSTTPYLLVPGADTTSPGVGPLGFTYDNVISAGYTLDNNGLLFSGNGWLINLYSGPDTFFDADYSFSYFAYGTITISPVPDGGLTAGLLGGALLGLGALRRKLQA